MNSPSLKSDVLAAIEGLKADYRLLQDPIKRIDDLKDEVEGIFDAQDDDESDKTAEIYARNARSEYSS